MTLCLGWTQGASAFVVVDSAVTIQSAATPVRAATEFSEPLIQSDTHTVQTGALKVGCLSGSFIGAIAGNADGISTLEALRDNLRESSGVETALQIACERAVDHQLLV